MVYKFDIYGVSGHRQRASFAPSYAFKREDGTAVAVICSDVTGTNDYCRLVMSVPSHQAAIDCLEGQLSDGVFENCNWGRVIERTGGRDAVIYWGC